MPDDSDPISMTNLFARLSPSRARLEAFVAGLTPTKLTTPFGDDGWTAKDHLAHIAAWEGGIAALLSGGSRAIAMGLSEEAFAKAKDADAVNAEIYANWRDRTLPDALDFFALAHANLLAALAKMDDSDLLLPYGHYERGPSSPVADELAEAANDDTRPIVGWIAGNTFGHFDEHMEWMAALKA